PLSSALPLRRRRSLHPQNSRYSSPLPSRRPCETHSNGFFAIPSAARSPPKSAARAIKRWQFRSAFSFLASSNLSLSAGVKLIQEGLCFKHSFSQIFHEQR